MDKCDSLEKLRALVSAAVARPGGQTKLSADAGVDQSTISRFVKSGTGLHLKNACKLIDALQMTICKEGSQVGADVEAKIRAEVANAVIDACIESPIDDHSRSRIIAAAKGKTLAVAAGGCDHEQHAVGGD